MKPVGNHNPAVSAYRQQTQVSRVGQASPAAQEGASEAHRGGGSARLTISSQAREMAGGAIDAAKVEALRKRLESGVLKFDSLAIAEKMLAE